MEPNNLFKCHTQKKDQILETLGEQKDATTLSEHKGM